MFRSDPIFLPFQTRTLATALASTNPGLLVAAIQNVRILLAHQNPEPSAAAAVALPASITRLQPALLTDHSLLASAIFAIRIRLRNQL
jgi:hypothetical protein